MTLPSQIPKNDRPLIFTEEKCKRSFIQKTKIEINHSTILITREKRNGKLA